MYYFFVDANMLSNVGRTYIARSSCNVFKKTYCVLLSTFQMYYVIVLSFSEYISSTECYVGSPIQRHHVYPP